MQPPNLQTSALVEKCVSGANFGLTRQEIRNLVPSIYEKLLIKAKSFSDFLQLFQIVSQRLLCSNQFDPALFVFCDAFDPICQIIPLLEALHPIVVLFTRPWSFVSPVEMLNFQLNLKNLSKFQVLVNTFCQESDFLIQNAKLLAEDFKVLFIADQMLEVNAVQNSDPIVAIRQLVQSFKQNVYQLKMEKMWLVCKQGNYKLQLSKVGKAVVQDTQIAGVLCVSKTSAMDEMLEFADFKASQARAMFK